MSFWRFLSTLLHATVNFQGTGEFERASEEVLSSKTAEQVSLIQQCCQ